MSRFVEGQDRQQVTLLPECLDDFIAEDNPVRVVDAFVAELALGELGFDGVRAGGHGPPVVPPGGAPEDLHLWVLEPRTEQPAAGTRMPAQRRADVVDGASGAGLQDHRGLPA